MLDCHTQNLHTPKPEAQIDPFMRIDPLERIDVFVNPVRAS